GEEMRAPRHFSARPARANVDREEARVLDEPGACELAGEGIGRFVSIEGELDLAPLPRTMPRRIDEKERRRDPSCDDGERHENPEAHRGAPDLRRPRPR